MRVAELGDMSGYELLYLLRSDRALEQISGIFRKASGVVNIERKGV